MDVAYACSGSDGSGKIGIPEDIERIFVRKWSNDDDPIMWITLIQEEEYDDPYYLVEQHIKKPLERIDGVANVEIWGAEEKEILIMINQDQGTIL